MYLCDNYNNKKRKKETVAIKIIIIIMNHKNKINFVELTNKCHCKFINIF